MRKPSALTHLQQALEIARKLDSPLRQAQIHHQLMEIYKAEGAFEQALRHSEYFHKYDKRVFNEASDQRVRALQAMHKVEQARRETEIYRLQNMELQAESESDYGKHWFER